MEKFDIAKLISSYDRLPDDAYIYASREITETENLDKGEFLVISSEEEDEYVKIPEGEIPKQAYDLNMLSLIETTQFKDVIEFQKNRNQKSTIDDYKEAISFYLSFEDFLDDN